MRRLANSFLFELNDEIEKGPTKAREMLVRKALEYLDDMAREDAGDASLRREVAAAYLKVGDVQGRPYRPNIGQTEGALSSYQKALAILEELAAADPADLTVRRDLATVYERIGNIQLRQNALPEALEKQRKAFAIRKELMAADPSNANYRRELADSYIYLGDAMQAQPYSTNEEGLRQVGEALALQREALALELPHDLQIRRDIAQAYMRVGFRLKSLGSLDKEALRQWLESERKALAIRESVVALDTKNTHDRRSLADQYMLCADAQLGNGDLAQALEGFRQALTMFKSLLAADPSSVETRRDLSFAYLKLAETWAKLRRPAAARENYGEVVRLTKQLQADDPASTEDLQTEALAHMGLSSLSEQAGDLAGAIESYRRVLDIYERINDRAKSDAASQRLLANHYPLLARMYTKAATRAGTPLSERAEKWRAALNAYRRALSFWQQLGESGKLNEADPGYISQIQCEVARCEAALGQ